MRRAPATPTWSVHRPVVRLLIIVAAALFVGRTTLGRFAGVQDHVFLWVLPLAVAVVLFMRHPKWCVAGIVAVTFFGLYQSGLSFGPLTMRLTDFPYCFLFGWAVLIRSRVGRVGRTAIGQRRVALFVAVLGLSVLPGFVLGLADTTDRLVSWGRLLATLSLVWLIPYAVREEKDRIFILNAVWISAAAELAYSIVTQFGPGRLIGRNGPNAEGMLGALLVVFALHAPVPRRRWVRVLIFGIGGVALIMTKSIASLTAAGLAIGVFGLRARKQRHSKEPLITPLRILAVALAAFGVLSVLRPQDLGSSRSFKGSSSGQRLLLGFAGLKIFADHPIAGVGWQRSSAEDVIASEELNEELRRQFPGFRRTLFPTKATSVHNMYIQVLADTGIIGGIILLLAIVAIIRGTRRVLAGTPPGRSASGVAAVALFVVAVWWNDNPLFGSSPESVAAAVFLGLLAAAPKRAPKPADPVVSATPETVAQS